MSTFLTDNSSTVFSVSLDHRWRTDFVDVIDAGTEHATGLSQFFGDEANALLRYLTTDDFLDQMTGQTSEQSAGLTPIVLYGPSGTGKTSLAMALVSKLIAAGITKEDSGHRREPPIFVSGSDFARRFYAAIETDSVDEFREKFLLAPAIVLDNLDQLVGKSPAQNELVSLIESCGKTGKPLFVTSAMLPLAFEGISSRLSSRLSSGLCLPMNPPGKDARLEIVKELAVIHGVELTEGAAEMLTERFEVTVPKIKHLFVQIRLKFEVEGSPSIIDQSSLTALLQPGDEDQQKMIKLIQKRVAKKFSLKLSDLKSASRKQTVVLARGIAIFLTRSLLGTSFVKIGNAFGNRDHSTVLHAYQKISGIYEQDTTNATATAIDGLKQQLTDQFAAQIYQT